MESLGGKKKMHETEQNAVANRSLGEVVRQTRIRALADLAKERNEKMKGAK